MKRRHSQITKARKPAIYMRSGICYSLYSAIGGLVIPLPAKLSEYD